LEAEVLKNKAKKFNLSGDAFKSVKEAYEYALEHANNDDLVFIGGSIFVVAEIL